MNSKNIFTRKTMGLDNRVWRFMIIVILLPLILLSYKLADKQKCTSFSFNVRSLGINNNDGSANVFYTGETLSFTASVPSGNISWDFGDNTSDVGQSVHHQFFKEGIYAVTAGSNSLCETEREITIKNPPAKVKTAVTTEAPIAGPASCYTYTQQIFTYPGAATSYEWSIPNHQSLGTRTGQTITYTFPYAGKYNIQVELDHDRTKRYTIDVVVEDEVKTKSQIPEKITPLIVPNNPPPVLSLPQAEAKPAQKMQEADTAAAPAGNKILHIADGTFFNYLEKVADKEMDAKEFEKYGIYESTPVVVNGKREKKTFSELCEDISGKKKKLMGLIKKKVKLESAQLHRMNDVITVIDVNYK